jgi:hypothetical protein
MLIITGCVSKPRAEIILPPEPQREELPEIKTMSDIAHVLNYYEHLVEKWELWANSVKIIVSENPSQSGQ